MRWPDRRADGASFIQGLSERQRVRGAGGPDYNSSVEPREIEAFVGRDWEGAAALKASHWPDRFRREGWREVWNAAQSLLLHVRAVRPDFPSDRERDEDFEHHLTLKSRLDRAAHAFSRS